MSRRTRSLETQRLYALAAIPVFLFAWLYREIERRQRLDEGRQETRRAWVDTQLSKLSEDALAHRERASGRASVGRTLIAVAGVVLTIVTIVSLLTTTSVI